MLGLAIVALLGFALVCIGQATRHSGGFYDVLVQHVETQRRLRRQPPLPARRYQRDRRSVSTGFLLTGSLILVLGLLPLIGDLVRP